MLVNPLHIPTRPELELFKDYMTKNAGHLAALVNHVSEYAYPYGVRSAIMYLPTLHLRLDRASQFLYGTGVSPAIMTIDPWSWKNGKLSLTLGYMPAYNYQSSYDDKPERVALIQGAIYVEGDPQALLDFVDKHRWHLDFTQVNSAFNDSEILEFDSEDDRVATIIAASYACLPVSA